jgi:putative hydrolase
MQPPKRGIMIVFNDKAAGLLRDCGELLRQQDANPFRVNAYLHAAATLESLGEDARDILEREGVEGLVALPGIGRGLAGAIEEIARTGRLSRLEHLRGAADPEALFRTVPGVGPQLAHEIHDRLQIDSLEALELAAHDGRLRAIPGIGPRRLAGIRAALAAQLRRGGARPRRHDDGPPVAILLDVDREYRERARAGELTTLAPKRFNPGGKAWLPVLHTVREPWHFTALYSNTARAHELGRTSDWVVIYVYDADHEEGQYTVVTETHGPLSGKRVVRGREAESAVVHAQTQETTPIPRSAFDR